MAKWRQQVSRNAFGDIRVLLSEEVQSSGGTARVPAFKVLTDPDVIAAADLLDAAVDAALGLDGADPAYAPPVAEKESAEPAGVTFVADGKPVGTAEADA